MKFSALSFLILLFISFQSSAQDKPNILWLVTEDMSPYLSSYGNKLIETPNLDQLAAGGIRYTRAFSNGTQCSPSRSTIILGRYATSMGTDYHRQPVNVEQSLYFPIFLQKGGYFTVNNAKQDYNTLKTPKDMWNATGGKADYNDRPDKKQPFYAQYNQGITHMTRVAKDIDKRSPDVKRSVKMKDVIVPAYLPDLPEIRDDISWNMGAVEKMDDWVGEKIEELKSRGEYENTIIIFSSDHGGSVPRGKAYPYHSGTLIPLIVHFPDKWKHLAGDPVGSVSNRLVSFVDFAPTFMSLAGLDIPSHMMGKPFLTAAANKPENKNKYVLTFRTNQGPVFIPSRGIFDGKYHLIWNFQTAYPNGSRQDYQWQMPAQQAWDKAWMKGELKSDLHKSFWEPMPTYELYDVENDSLEVENLALHPKNFMLLWEMRTELLKILHETGDLGFIPIAYKLNLQKNQDLVSLVREQNINIDEIIDAAALASGKGITGVEKLLDLLKSSNPSVQYWGASGLCAMARAGELDVLPDAAKNLLDNPKLIPEASLMIAEAMVYTSDVDRNKGLEYMMQLFKQGSAQAGAGLQNVGARAKSLNPALQEMLKDPKSKNKFFIRSILINTGALPYEALYQLSAGESIPD